MPCERCGAEGAEGAEACARCGEPLRGADAPTLFVARGRGQATLLTAAGGDAAGAVTHAVTRAATYVPLSTTRDRFSTPLGAATGGAPAAPGTLLDVVRRDLGADYDVEREVGRGGMAVVFQATERELRRPVALKVLPPELAYGGSMADRFKREARMAASLDHANIIPVYRVGQVGTTSFMAMKFIDGRGLDAVITAQGPLPVPVALLLLRGAADALAYAHEHGIVHRDVKPANIMLDGQGRPLVTDFGVARAIEDASMTAPGSVIGTPWFMSPEQCGGKGTVGPQSDQYSLGVVAFQLLTGRVPFDSDTLAGIMQHHFFTPVPDLRVIRPDVPSGLVAVVVRALSKDQRHRFGTTADMVRALEAVPLGEAERRWGESMLRQLALGVRIPPIDAAAFPPPPQADEEGEPLAPAPSARLVRWGIGAGVAAATLLVGAMLSYDGPAGAATPEMPSVATATIARPGGAASSATDSAVRAADAAPSARTGAPDASAVGRTAPRTRAARPALVSTPAAPAPVAVAVAAPAVARAAEGKLRVRTFPADAEIFIDGATVGRGLVIDADVRAGERRLRVSAPGYATLDTTFTVVAGETAQLGRLTLRTPEE